MIEDKKKKEKEHRYNTDNFIRWATDGEIKKCARKRE